MNAPLAPVAAAAVPCLPATAGPVISRTRTRVIALFGTASWIIAAAVIPPPPVLAATGDPVAEWNTALSLFARQRLSGNEATPAHLYAVTHAAISRAVASAGSAGAGADLPAADAAVAAAAFHVIENLIPAASRPFAALRDAQLGALPAGRSTRSGIDAGLAAARAILAQRRNDGWPRLAEPGAARAALAGELLRLVGEPAPFPYQTFVLARPAQFAPELPFWITPGGDILPVRRLQESRVLEPGGDPTEETLQFWRENQVVRWNAIAGIVARQKAAPMARSARMFQLLNCALADALAAALYWRAEYNAGHSLWVGTLGPAEPGRDSPHAGDVAAEAGGRIGVQVRNHPAVGAVLAGAAEGVLIWFTGADAVDLSAAGARLPPQVRGAPSFSCLAKACARAALVNENAAREAGISGYELGLKIGEYVVRRRT